MLKRNLKKSCVKSPVKTLKQIPNRPAICHCESVRERFISKWSSEALTFLLESTKIFESIVLMP